MHDPISRHAAAAAVALTLTLVLAACYGSSASPTPGGPSVVLQELTRHGVRIVSAVGGDAGCDDASLADNANHLRVRLASDAAETDLYLFTFRSRDYAAERPAVDACQATFGADSGGASPDRVDVEPYRAFGTGWSPGLRSAVTDALAQAARGGAIRGRHVAG